MTESKDFSAEAGSAKVVGTVSSTDIAEPVAPPLGMRAIGPRITFHFVGEWDAETSYALYDVVRVNGTSYIGNKINIAKGINPETDNNVHWVKWNDPNAQVELLQQTVNAFDSRINEAETEAMNAAADATAAKKASADNATAISAEATRAQAAEAANAAAIEAEATRARAAEAANATAIEEVKETFVGCQIKTGYDMDSKTQWKMFTFPKAKYPLENIALDVSMEQQISDLNYYKWMLSQNEGFYFNGALKGTAISNGRIKYAAADSDSEYWYLLLIKNGVISVRKDISRTQTAADLIAEGYSFACGIWHPVIINNVKFDVANLPTSDSNYDYIVNRKHSRTLFAWDADNWHVIIIEGRGYINAGCDFEGEYRLCKTLGIVNAVNMDGGHSCQAWSTAPTFNYVYQNSSDKPYGFASGNIFAFISAHKKEI